MSRSSRAATSSAPSASCPIPAARSGCARPPTSSPRSGRRPTPGASEVQLLGQIVNHYQAPDDPSCDFAELLARVNEVAGIERIRFASPHPRHVTPRMIAGDARSAQGLPAPASSGAERLRRACCRRCAAGTRASEYLELVAALREAMPDIALSTDMIVGFPGEARDDFEDDAVAHAGGALSQHVLLQILAAAEHARAQAAARRRHRRTEKTRGSWRSSRCSGRFRGSCSARRSGASSRC